MKLTINGETQNFDLECDKINLQAFLTESLYKTNDAAVAINLTFVPKSKYSECYLKDGDDIEIVVPMQGG